MNQEWNLGFFEISGSLLIDLTGQISNLLIFLFVCLEWSELMVIKKKKNTKKI